MRNSILPLLMAGFVMLAGCQTTQPRAISEIGPIHHSEYRIEFSSFGEWEASATEFEVADAVVAVLAEDQPGVGRAKFEQTMMRMTGTDARKLQRAVLDPAYEPHLMRDSNLPPTCSLRTHQWVLLESYRLAFLFLNTQHAELMSDTQESILRHAKLTEAETECLRHAVKLFKLAAIRHAEQ